MQASGWDVWCNGIILKNKIHVFQMYQWEFTLTIYDEVN